MVFMFFLYSFSSDTYMLTKAGEKSKLLVVDNIQ